MFVGQVEIRTANQSGQESGLGEREGGEVLVKIDRSRLAESIDGKTIMLTEIDLIGVKDENLILGQPVLEDHGEKDFCQFPPDRAAGGQEKVSCELHGQCTATLEPLVRAEIGDGSRDHTERIHAVVRVKSMVFGSENGIHQRLGEVLVMNQMTLGAAGAKEGGDGFGLKPVALQGGHIVE